MWMDDKQDDHSRGHQDHDEQFRSAHGFGPARRKTVSEAVVLVPQRMHPAGTVPQIHSGTPTISNDYCRLLTTSQCTGPARPATPVVSRRSRLARHAHWSRPPDTLALSRRAELVV